MAEVFMERCEGRNSPSIVFKIAMVNDLGTSENSQASASVVGAFFDVDNTLVPGLSIEERFFFHLLKQKLIGLGDVLDSLLFLLRQMPPISRQPLREYKLYLQGLRPSVIEPLAKKFVEKTIFPRLSSDAVETLKHHQQCRHQVILVTASLNFLVTPLAERLQVDSLFAANPELRNDIYTGRLIPPFPYGEGKRLVAEQYAKEKLVDLSQSYAYGDSPGDMELLKVVGFPNVVNPIRGMKALANREGWPITKWN